MFNSSTRTASLFYFLIALLLIIFAYLKCSAPHSKKSIGIRPSRFSDGDAILLAPAFRDVQKRFKEMHVHYFEKKHHQFHHKNSSNFKRFVGSYGLGYWDLRNGDISIPGNREETHFSPYPCTSVSAEVALAYTYAWEATNDGLYLKCAIRILDNFLRHEQLRALNPDALLAEPMSLIGSFSDWKVRGDFPTEYKFPGLYIYKDNPTPKELPFSLLQKLSIPHIQPHEQVVFDSVGYNPGLKIGSVIVYSGEHFPELQEKLNQPTPDNAGKAVAAYAEAILNDFPNKALYLKIISEAVQGLYGFELRNQWEVPSTEAGSRVIGLCAAVNALKYSDCSAVPGKPLLPLSELARDALLRIRNVADPTFPGWFHGWTPGGPLPLRFDWWIVQTGPDFLGTDTIAGKRYPWLIQVYDNYGTSDDIQLWHFSRTLLGIATFYPMIGDEYDSLRTVLKDFLCQGFNYYLHFQETDSTGSFKGGISPNVYSVYEFSTNQQCFMKFHNGDESVIKRYSQRYFGEEALTYPFPIGLQAAITAAMNIPELEASLQDLINSGMNHLLECEVFYKPRLEHPELRYMQNWLAPEVFKTLGLYLKYRKSR